MSNGMTIIRSIRWIKPRRWNEEVFDSMTQAGICEFVGQISGFLIAKPEVVVAKSEVLIAKIKNLQVTGDS